VPDVIRKRSSFYSVCVVEMLWIYSYEGVK
jgi:hypothetical protein